MKTRNTIRVDGQDIEYYKIEHDLNGNPRYVIHFLTLAKPDHEKHGINAVSIAYNEAIRKASCIGGRKYRAKWYGGGIVFSSYNLEDSLLYAMKQE